MAGGHIENDDRGITRRHAIGMLASVGGGAALVLRSPDMAFAAAGDQVQFLIGRVVASGIPGASAISQVGVFLAGSPIHDNPVLAELTQPGRVLDPTRVLVGSRSNFGAPRAQEDQFEGSFLSIDPGSADVTVPALFASTGDQASALGGAVQMYSAQSPNFLNGIYHPAAVTLSLIHI